MWSFSQSIPPKRRYKNCEHHKDLLYSQCQKL